LGLKNIFEGVEALTELNIIREMSGEVIQGYLFSKPLKSDEAVQWLDKDKIVGIV